MNEFIEPQLDGKNRIILERTPTYVIKSMVLDALENGYQQQAGIPSATQKLKNKMASFFVPTPFPIKELASFRDKLNTLDANKPLESVDISKLLYILFANEVFSRGSPLRVNNAFLAARKAIVGETLYQKARCSKIDQEGEEHTPWEDSWGLWDVSGREVTYLVLSCLYNSNSLTQALVIKLYEVLTGFTQAQSSLYISSLKEGLNHFICLLHYFTRIDQANNNKGQDYSPFIQPFIIDKLLGRLLLPKDEPNATKTNYSLVSKITQIYFFDAMRDKPEGAQLFSKILDRLAAHPAPEALSEVMGKGFRWAPRLFEQAAMINAVSSVTSAEKVRTFAITLEEIEWQHHNTPKGSDINKEAFTQALLSAGFTGISALSESQTFPFQGSDDFASTAPPFYSIQRRG